MKFEFLADASDTPPKRPSNPSVGYPSNGDPVTGKPPTTPGAWFYYMLMVEFTTLIEQNGLEPSAENLHQLADVFADFKARASAAEGFATQAKASADAAAESASGVVTETASKIKEIQDEGSKQVSAVTAAGGSVSGDVEAGIASLQKKLEELVAQLDAEGGTEAAYVKQQAQDILDQITASESNAKTYAENAAASASSAATTVSDGKQAITDLQAAAVAAIQTQKNEAVAAVTATQSTATESVTAAQATSVSAVKAQESASIQAIEADSVLAGYAKKDELSSAQSALSAQISAAIAQAVADAKLAAHPVGSLYWSTQSTDPASLFGGTWEQVKDRFVLAAGDSYTVGATGGAANVTLTTEQMPPHNHAASTNETGGHNHTRGSMEITGGIQWSNLTEPQGAFYKGSYGNAFGYANNHNDWTGIAFAASRSWTGSTSTNGDHSHTVTVNNTGGGQAHENMPPYLVAYCWERTA